MTKPTASWADYAVPDQLPTPIIGEAALPLVSIVTPSYNQGRFIRQTIKSVLDQEYPNIEYWVIDGGSTDETIAILQEYEHDARFHWISERDRGQSDAINKGWRRCSGDIFAWLNSDDTYLPGAIRSQAQALQQHHDSGVVYGDALYIDEQSAPLYTAYGRPYHMLELLRLTIPAQPTTFIRRTVCEAIGPMNEHFKYSMDSEYWVRAAKIAGFWYEPGCIATYRLHDRSKTIADRERFYHEWLAILDDFYADPHVARRYSHHKSSLYADIYSTIAALEFRQGSLKRGIEFFSKSLAMGTVRPRMFTIVLALIDRNTSLHVSSRFVQWWTRVRSRRTTSAH
jgi:glycosyltransferase involved in cell wall biosynthesis